MLGQREPLTLLALFISPHSRKKGASALLHFACLGFFAGLILKMIRNPWGQREPALFRPLSLLNQKAAPHSLAPVGSPDFRLFRSLAGNRKEMLYSPWFRANVSPSALLALS